MKKLLSAGLVAAILMLIALPALAARLGPVGIQVDLFPGADVTVSGPFHVRHGVILQPGEEKALGKWEFVLTVDGERQRGQLLVSNSKESGTQTRTWLFNFPDGMQPGDYTFLGRWLGPCADSAGPCDNPNEQVEIESRSITVTVTD